MSKTNTSDYNTLITQLGHTLSQFQLIEEWIKAYISTSFRIIKASLPAEVTFDFKADDYEDAALGVLLKVFRKLNSNKNLHAKLDKIKKERDYVAHKAANEITWLSMEGDSKAAAILCTKLVALESEATDLFHQVSEEMIKLRAYEEKDNGA